MRIASLKSRTARSRSPLRLACLPLAISAATLALTGFVMAAGVACGGAAGAAASSDMGVGSSARAVYGVTLPTAKSSAATTGPLRALDDPQLEVISLKAPLSTQGGSFSVFGAAAAVARPEVFRAQGLLSDIDDPLPHAAAIIVVAGAAG